MAIRVVIDGLECDGCQTCVELCPEVFEVEEDAVVTRVIKPESDVECVERAIYACLGACIY